MTYKHSICFSGSGYHYPWQVGVAWHLQEHYDLSDCCFIGVSAGSFVASLLSTNTYVKMYILNCSNEVYTNSNESKLGRYTIFHDVLKHINSKYMEKDACKHTNDRCYISITKMNRCSIKNQLVHEFSSNHDLCNAICASSHIPFINSPSFFYMFRNEKCLDGGATYNWVKLNEATMIIPPYKWDSFKNSTYLLQGLITDSEYEFYELMTEGYLDAKANDCDFTNMGLVKKS